MPFGGLIIQGRFKLILEQDLQASQDRKNHFPSQAAWISQQAVNRSQKHRIRD
jgi:hypothetical protein